jgi:predicted ferric reductase
VAAQAEGVEIQLTLRKHGAATNLLFSHPLHATAAPLEVPVLGIGGEERFRIAYHSLGDDDGATTKKKAVFVAGGIGITPLLAQAPGLLAPPSERQERRRRLEVLWSLRAEDLALAADALERIPGLGDVTRVFVAGVHEGNGNHEETIGRLRKLGAQVEVRRMGQADVLEARDTESGTRYFACASPRLLRSVMDWLAEEEVAFESFEY